VIQLSQSTPHTTAHQSAFGGTEVDILVGNPAKAEKLLGWKTLKKFEELVKIKVLKDLKNSFSYSLKTQIEE